jgi:hypothetical protein
MRFLVLTLALFSITAQAEGLEVSLVVSTAEGIQFEPIHGCYEYGLFVKAATAEKNFGRSIASHLEGLSEVEVYREGAGLAILPKMGDFIRSELVRIHDAPPIDASLAGVAARELCRQAGGKTWVFGTLRTAAERPH